MKVVLRKTTRIRFGKAGAHPQLALGIAIAPETLYLIATFQFLRQLRFFRFSLRFLFYFMVQFLFASQMWAARPHLGSIFEKLLHRKTFQPPAARCLQSSLLFQKLSQLRFQQCPYCSIREILLPSSLSGNQFSPQARIGQNAVCNHRRLHRVFLIQ